MRVKSIMLTVGFLSMIGATVALSSSNSVVTDAQRVDVIDSLPAGWQWDSMQTSGEKFMRVDVIDNVEWRGPVYAFTGGSMRVDVIDNIGS